MKMKSKRAVSAFLSLCMALALAMSFGMTVRAEGDTAALNVTVQFGQTEARTMLQMVNDFRASSDAWAWNADDTQQVQYTDLSALQYDYELEKVAMQRAAEIALSFEHERPDGSGCFTAYPSGYSAMGENIAAGQRSAQEVFTAWREDNDKHAGQGHRRNMLGSGFNKVGFGHVYFNGTHYWVQEFGYSDAATTETAAQDSEVTVAVNVALANIKQMGELQLSADKLSVGVGQSAGLPTVSVQLLLNGTWTISGNGFSAQAAGAWSVADPSIADVENGQIVGKSLGSTTLKVSALGGEVSIPVTVTADGASGDGSGAEVAMPPTIQGEEGSQGWEAIQNKVDLAQDGDTVNVNMNGATEVPGSVIDSIKGKDIDLVLNMGNGISWKIDGQTVTADTAANIDFSVNVGVSSIPADVIQSTAGDKDVIQISLGHDGDFGLTAVLTVNVGTEHNGMYANRFYYNPANGKLEYQSASTVNADGNAAFAFTHASDYALVMAKEKMDGSQPPKPSDSNPPVSNPKAPQNQIPVSPKTGEGADVQSQSVFVIAGTVILAFGMSGAFLLRRKEK